MEGYQPAVDQSWNPRPNRGWVKWVLAGSLALLVIGGAGWWLLSHRGVPANVAQLKQAVEASLSGCDTAKNPDACKAQLVTSAATGAKALSVCDALAGEGKDDCIWNVAKQMDDASACASMSDKARAAACSDDVTLRAAVAAGDASKCAAIHDPSFKASCTEQIDPLTAANCAAQGRDAAFCAALAQRDAAVAAGDLSLCAKIEVEEVSNSCVDRTGETDVDHDGLTALAEQGYGTDPQKADTDGDGFSDGDEVKNGFNPNGPGKL